MKLTPLENWILHRTSIGTKSREALEEYQFSQLIKTLNYAKEKSRYYRRELRHIDIDSIKSMRYFAAVPFTFPQDIIKNPRDFLCVAQKEIKRIVTMNTSGTSGDEKRIYFSEKDLKGTIDFFQHGMRCLIDQRDHVLVLLPGNAYGSIGDLLKKALRLSDIECIVHGVLTNLEEVKRCIEENNITCIVGIPMQVLYLSRMKSDVFRKHIKKVLLSTDYVPDVLVRELKDQFNCDVFNHYGMTEMGYGGGVECEALNGYHLREEDLYFEIVNPKTGAIVNDGQYGEVVFTTFNRQAMPLIRYRTGDIARFSTIACACGTFLKKMDKVIGRMTNKVVLKNSKEIHLRELDEIILAFREVLDYNATLYNDDMLSLLLILNDSSEFERMKEEITNRIYDRLNFKLDLDINWQPDDRTPKITNSMIKRKIYDFRKGEQ
ncbi:DVU_1553 family AMP-dependent CoA ligase [Marinisporobacter balticus]|uniref:Phenylacetate-coenzyme A ligase PaaK-like adenylate-forming protein n=1 Tax=Marinisporobacter balticus TaxID=2018667 RepID=A0A4R2KYP8_9FIRM|nr:AMP-binding protein [Marinisporobacter balticus]TCO71825.1 phenylacetate-coenzyme A ligase PaaK-like adenylate-forming protein [Marinisporobacter balticus]